MRFPNAFSGVKKIWLAELLMLLAAVIGIVLLVVVIGNTTVVDNTVIVNEAAIETPTAILGLGAALIALIAFILNLVGLIKARKDDDGFSIALIVTMLGIIASVISSIWSNNQGLTRWMDAIKSICNLFASYYVLTGIANLAEKFPDSATKALALKSRTMLEGTFCATVLFKLAINIFNIQDGSTVYTVLSVIALVLEIVSYILYLRALNQGKKMLAK